MWFRRNERKVVPIDDKTIRMRIHFYGRVQGVGFRFTACQIADSAGLTGWVRNEDDGSVIVEAQGHREHIDQMIHLLQQDRYIHIDYFDRELIPVNEHENQFNYRY